MKFLSVLALTLMLNVASNAQSIGSREADGLFGPVHTVIATNLILTKTNDLWTESSRRTASIISYDENGMDSRIPLGLNSTPSAATCVGRVNDIGQEIERDCTSHGRQLKMFFRYDAAGHVIDELQQDAEGKLIWHHSFVFDEKGRRTGLEEFDTDNKLKRRLTWSFDDKGNNIEITQSVRENDEMVLFQKNTSTYDDKGNVLMNTQLGNPKGNSFTQYFNYEFDARGNWVKQESANLPFDSPDLRMKTVSLREITYYEK